MKKYIGDVLEITQGCILEIIMKDTHTCGGRPERFRKWVNCVNELISEER